jgi:hypothetical protein
VKNKTNREDVLKLIDLIHNPDIGSEARTTAIGMLEKLTGRNILTKKDVFRILEEYENV